MKKWEFSLLVALVIVTLTGNLYTFANDCTAVCNDTLRLHILADSDTPQDQANKLAVRDAILSTYGTLFATAENKADAIALTQAQLDAITQTAQQTLAQCGTPLPVHAQIETMYFPTKQYDGFTLPAGQYDAMRIELGTAQGHNWFCVMYPMLCVPSAQPEEAFAQYDLAEQAVLQDKAVWKFAIVEWFTQHRQKSLAQ